MLWIEFVLMLVGGFAAAAAFSAAIAVLVFKLMGEEDDNSRW